MKRETCQNECFTGLGTLWGTLFDAGRAEVSLCSTPPPPRQGLWAVTTTITLVRRQDGGLRCCVLTPC